MRGNTAFTKHGSALHPTSRLARERVWRVVTAVRQA